MISFTLPGAELATAAGFLAGLAPSNPVSPELGGVVIEAAGTEEALVSLSVFDRDLAGTVTLSGDVGTPGAVLVSAKLLAAVASTIGAEKEVALCAADTRLQVRAGRSRWTLPILDQRFYPDLPVPGVAVGDLDVSELVDGLAAVMPMAGTKDDKPYGSGVVLASEEDSDLTIVATNGYRLGQVQVPWTPYAALPDLVAPAELLKLAQAAGRRETAKRVSLVASQRRIGLVGETFAVSGPTLAHPNPGAWRRVDAVRGESTTTAQVYAADLLQVAARAAALADDAEALALFVGNDELGVGVRSRFAAGPEHLCDLIAQDGPDVTVGLDARYLRDAVTALGSPMVALGFSAQRNAAVLLQPADEAGEILGGRRQMIQQKRLDHGGGNS